MGMSASNYQGKTIKFLTEKYMVQYAILHSDTATAKEESTARGQITRIRSAAAWGTRKAELDASIDAAVAAHKGQQVTDEGAPFGRDKGGMPYCDAARRDVYLTF